MKQQILKLAKRLSRFTFEDIQTMVELDENETSSLLKSLVSEGYLKQNAEEYFYIPKKNSAILDSLDLKIRKILAPNFSIEELLINEEDLAIYNQLSKNVKEKVYKNLVLIKCAGNLGGIALENFLLEFGKKSPKFQMAFSTFHRRRKMYIENGLQALIPKYGVNRGKTVITDEQYNLFKILYLSPEALPSNECVKKMEEMGAFQNKLIPNPVTFERQVQKEYTRTQILNFRKKQGLGSTILNTLAESKNEKYENFLDGVNAFLEYDYLKSLAQAKAIKASLKNHIIPYFKDYPFKEINEEVLRKFKKDKMTSGLSPASVSRLVAYLKYVVEGYSADTISIQTYKKAKVSTLGLKNKYEIINTINKVKNTDLYLPVLLVLSLGLKIAEVEPLTWDDIDIVNNEIKIDKIMINGVVTKYRKLHQKRICKIPATLSKILKLEKEKAMRIFGSITNQQLQTITKEEQLSFDILRDSYIKDLIDHQIPLNLISKRLGFCHTNEFLEHYETFIDETIIDNYDPLKV